MPELRSPAPRSGGGRFVLAIVLAVASAALFCGCRTGESGSSRTESDVPIRPIDDVLAAHSAELMATPGVVIVFVGALDDGSPCLTVGVVEESAAIRSAIPRRLEGYPVVVQVTGPLGPR